MNNLNLNPEEQQRKSRFRKFLFLAIVLVITGFALNFSAFLFDKSSWQPLMLIRSGGLCWIVAYLLIMLPIRRPRRDTKANNQGQRQASTQRKRMEQQGSAFNRGNTFIQGPSPQSEPQNNKMSSQRLIVKVNIIFALLLITDVILIIYFV